MKLAFTPIGWEDYQWWLKHEKDTLKRINRLIEDTLRNPTSGIGKPEPLRHVLQGAWSRRITEEHRTVYLHSDSEVTILQLRYHY